MSTTNHAQTDGLTERCNKTLEGILRAFVGQNIQNWDHFLGSAEFAYNGSYQASIQMTPFFADLGMDPPRNDLLPVTDV